MKVQINNKSTKGPQEVPVHFYDSQSTEEIEHSTVSEQIHTEHTFSKFAKYKSIVFFVLGVVFAFMVSYIMYSSKYQWIVDTLEAKEARQAQMEYNTQVIMDKVAENNKLLNEDKADNEAMVNAIAETFKKKEAKITTNE